MRRIFNIMIRENSSLVIHRHKVLEIAGTVIIRLAYES